MSGLSRADEARKAFVSLRDQLAAMEKAHSTGGILAEFHTSIAVEPPTPTAPMPLPVRHRQGSCPSDVAAALTVDVTSSVGTSTASLSGSDHITPISPSSSASSRQGSSPPSACTSPSSRVSRRLDAEISETRGDGKFVPMAGAAARPCAAPVPAEPLMLVAAVDVLAKLRSAQTAQHARYQRAKQHYKGQYGLLGRAMSWGKDHYEKSVKPEKVLLRSIEEEVEKARLFTEVLERQARAAQGGAPQQSLEAKGSFTRKSSAVKTNDMPLGESYKAASRQASLPPAPVHMVAVDKASCGSTSSMGESDTPQTQPAAAPAAVPVMPAVPGISPPPTGPTTVVVVPSASGSVATAPVPVPVGLTRGSSFSGSACDTEDMGAAHSFTHSHTHSSHSPSAVNVHHDGECGSLACTLSGCSAGRAATVPMPSAARSGCTLSSHLAVGVSDQQSETSQSDILDTSGNSVVPPYPDAE